MFDIVAIVHLIIYLNNQGHWISLFYMDTHIILFIIKSTKEIIFFYLYN